MRETKRFITTLLMTVMILTGMAWMPAQKAEAAADFTQAVTLPINGTWSSEYWFPESEDVQWYKIVLPGDGKMTFMMMAYAKMSCSLYTDDLAKSTSFYDWYGTESSPVTKSAERVLSKGTYYLAISPSTRGSERGKYKVNVRFTDFQTNDSGAGSYDMPQTISLNSTVTGAITFTDKEDWYKIYIPKSQDYTIRLTSDFAADFSLCDQDLLNCIKKGMHNSGQMGEPSLTKAYEVTLTSGIYYFKVSYDYGYDSAGKYTLIFSPKACSHTYKASKVKATYFSQGYTHYTCSKCGASYNGSYTAKLSIPKESISSIRGAKKKLTLSWKKIKSVSGYEIRCSTNKNFKKNVKTVTVQRANTGKKTIAKLKSKKTYYVQVRAYATQNGTTVYGKWSAKKKVKVK